MEDKLEKSCEDRLIEEPTPEEYAADHERDTEACLRKLDGEIRKFFFDLGEAFDAFLDSFCDKYGFEKKEALLLLALMEMIDKLEK